MKNNAVQRTVGFKDMLKYLLSFRDSIKYSLFFILWNVVYDLVIKFDVSKITLFDYMVSLVALPIVIILSDMLPPHIKENYTFFTNPGIKRVLKVVIFSILAFIVMFCVHQMADLLVSDVSYTQRVTNAKDEEWFALVMGEVGNSIKFIP